MEPKKRGRPRKDQAYGRGELQINARYDAAGHGRRMRSWNPPSTGPNKAVQGIQTVRNRTRDARRNDWAGESGIQRWTTNLIGIGIVPRFKRIASKARKLEVTDLWNDFVAKSDADGVLTLYGQQTLATTSWLESGEVFIRRRDRGVDTDLPVPVQVQLIEAEFVPMLDADQWPGLSQNNRIRSGIELSRSNQRVAYWMFKEHPGDGTSGSTISTDKLIRVPAEQVRHIFMPSRPGALRGVSPMAAVLARLRNVSDYDDAVLERQKLANLFMAFIKWNLPNLMDADTDPLTGLPLQGSGESPLASLSPGIVQELDPGQEVQFANPPEAGTMYSDYMRTQHLGTSAGLGIPYEIFSGDIKDVSDRTLRVVINEFRRLAEQRQWQIIIPMMCQPVVEWFARAAALVGKISVAEIDMVRRCEHAPHGWQHIHPVQDPQGKQLEVQAGFRSRSSVIGERGDDPDMVDDERAADVQREKDLDLWVDPNPAPAGANPEDDDEKPADKKANALLMQSLGRIEGAMAAPRPEPKSEPVQLTINNHIPQTVVENHVEPTPVTVNNEVATPNVSITNEVATPSVNVAAPTVTVSNNVEPAEVKVIMPNRKTDTTIERDAKGNIVKATQIESDADGASASLH